MWLKNNWLKNFWLENFWLWVTGVDEVLPTLDYTNEMQLDYTVDFQNQKVHYDAR